MKPGQEGRISEAVELAMNEGSGLVVVSASMEGDTWEKTFSTKLACPDHGISIEELEPRMFSFNAPFGACPACNGLGFTAKIDPERIIDYDKSIMEGALNNIFASMEYASYYRQVLEALADMHHVSLDMPFREMPAEFVKELLYGTGSKHLVYDYTSRTTGKGTSGSTTPSSLLKG